MHNHPRTARLYGLGESELRHVRSRWVSRFKWGKNTKGRTTLLCVHTSPQYDNEAVIPVRLRPGIWGWLPHWLSDVRILQVYVLDHGMPNFDSALTTLNTNTETNTAIHSSQFDSVSRNGHVLAALPCQQ